MQPQAGTQALSESNIIPIEDLMDASIDDIKDLPPFEVPAVGHYKLQVSLERKVVNDKPTISANFVVLEVLELADPSGTPPTIGTKFNVLHMMDNEFGQGGFKAFIGPIVKGLGMSSPKVSEVIATVQNVNIIGTLKHRFGKLPGGKPDPDKVYASISNAELV